MDFWIAFHFHFLKERNVLVPVNYIKTQPQSHRLSCLIKKDDLVSFMHHLLVKNSIHGREVRQKTMAKKPKNKQKMLFVLHCLSNLP